MSGRSDDRLAQYKTRLQSAEEGDDLDQEQYCGDI